MNISYICSKLMYLKIKHKNIKWKLFTFKLNFIKLFVEMFNLKDLKVNNIILL